MGKTPPAGNLTGIVDPPLSLNVAIPTEYPVLSCVIRIENAVAPEGGFRSVNCVTSSSTVNVND